MKNHSKSEMGQAHSGTDRASRVAACCLSFSQTAKKTPFLGAFFALIIVSSVSTSQAVGIAALKEQSYHADAAANVFAYQDKEDDGIAPFVTFVTGTRRTRIDRPKIAATVEVPTTIPVNITNETEVTPLRKSLEELAAFSGRFPQSSQMLAGHIAALSAHISKFNNGDRRTNGKWVTSEELAASKDAAEKEEQRRLKESELAERERVKRLRTEEAAARQREEAEQSAAKQRQEAAESAARQRAIDRQKAETERAAEAAKQREIEAKQSEKTKSDPKPKQDNPSSESGFKITFMGVLTFLSLLTLVTIFVRWLLLGTRPSSGSPVSIPAPPRPVAQAHIIPAPPVQSAFKSNPNLVSCPDCGKLVSCNAEKCPSCGKRLNHPVTATGCLAVIVLLVLGVLLLWFIAEAIKHQIIYGGN